MSLYWKEILLFLWLFVGALLCLIPFFTSYFTSGHYWSLVFILQKKSVACSVDVCFTSVCCCSHVLCLLHVFVKSVRRMSAATAPMFSLLYQCLLQWRSSVTRASARGSPESLPFRLSVLSIHEHRWPRTCTSRVCVCVCMCCVADIVSLAEVAMTPADVAFSVCVYVDVMSITLSLLTLQEETSSGVTQRRKRERESTPIGPVWTALIAVELNLLLLYFIPLSKHVITYRTL